MRQYKDIFINDGIFTECFLWNIGYEKCKPSHSYGPAMREVYLIHYITSGKGTYETKEATYHLSEGNFFIIRPNDVAYYEADLKDPWSYYWIGFLGSKTTEVLKSNGIEETDDIGKLKENQNLINLFDLLISNYHLNNQKKIINQSLFLQILSIFEIENKQVINKVKNKQNKKYSHIFLLYIRNNYYRSDLKIVEIANFIGINSAYLSQIIKKEFGIPPITYIREFRLQKASVLLETTDITIEEVSYRVGYQSVKSFSRAFKETYKISPSKYVGQY